MMFLPPLRRLLLPSLVCLAFILVYRSSHRLDRAYLSSLLLEQPSIHFPNDSVKISNLTSRQLLFQNPEGNHIPPPANLYYDYGRDQPDDAGLQGDNDIPTLNRYVSPKENRFLNSLLECRIKPNRFTSHIRLPVYIRPISMVVTGETENEKREFLNAAPMSLPYWSKYQYLLVTRVQTDGSSQLNIVCEANICYTDEAKKRPGEQRCTDEELELLGGTEGMRCATPPLTINVPPTAAKKCTNNTASLMDIPGFHDPRIFWSGRGEPLMMMNTQSQYACFGLWVIDLRKVHSPLSILLGANPKLPTMGPLMSYPSLTEITRNPPESRGPIEKNWMFFSNGPSTYVHYDMSPTIRTFAQLLGGGLTTPNLTDPYELPCVADGAKPKEYEVWGGSWHQGTNSLKLILCERNDLACRPTAENTVFWALVHHKHKNVYSLPLRYERYFIVWSSTPPFQMLATSKYPVLLANESASGWEPSESWDDDEEHQEMVKAGGKGKGDFAVFTYTPSIAYAWGRENDQPQDKNTGFLDDEVILGVGIDDMAQGYARAKVADLLQCMRTCPGRASEPLNKVSPEKKKEEAREGDNAEVKKDSRPGQESDGASNEDNQLKEAEETTREYEKKEDAKQEELKEEEGEKNQNKTPETSQDDEKTGVEKKEQNDDKSKEKKGQGYETNDAKNLKTDNHKKGEEDDKKRTGVEDEKKKKEGEKKKKEQAEKKKKADEREKKDEDEKKKKEEDKKKKKQEDDLKKKEREEEQERKKQKKKDALRKSETHAERPPREEKAQPPPKA